MHGERGSYIAQPEIFALINYFVGSVCMCVSSILIWEYEKLWSLFTYVLIPVLPATFFMRQFKIVGAEGQGKRQSYLCKRLEHTAASIDPATGKSSFLLLCNGN